MSNRFMIDDAGTLIDKSNGWCYDYPSEILPLLNELAKRADKTGHYKRLARKRKHKNKVLRYTITNQMEALYRHNSEIKNLKKVNKELLMKLEEINEITETNGAISRTELKELRK